MNCTLNFVIFYSLFTDNSGLENEKDLIKMIGQKMCYEKHVDFKKEFQIFNACRFQLCHYYDEDIDLDLVCYWGKKD